ncbi:hypothetical protein EJB05_46839, partial [Eragrostis curvula]
VKLIDPVSTAGGRKKKNQIHVELIQHQRWRQGQGFGAFLQGGRQGPRLPRPAPLRGQVELFANRKQCMFLCALVWSKESSIRMMNGATLFITWVGTRTDAKGDKDDTKTLVKGKRKIRPGAEEKEKRSSESLLVSQFLLALKKQLVDDWEFVSVTQLGKVVKLP